MTERSYQGVIVFYRADKGYGCVRVPDTREEFYFRAANLRQPVRAGDRVRFVLKQDRRGFYADHVELVLLG